jgi:hypothetical protein
MSRPNWNQSMAGCGGAEPHDNEPVIITRGTARLALPAIEAELAADYYHNSRAAAEELRAVLEKPVLSAQQKLANLDASLAECESYCATKSGAAKCNCGSWYFRSQFAKADSTHDIHEGIEVMGSVHDDTLGYAQRERERLRESEDTFFARILRTVESNEIPGMEPWNVDNAVDLMRRMKAAYDKTRPVSTHLDPEGQ